MSCAFVKKGQCDAHITAVMVKAAVVEGGDLEGGGKSRVCHGREFRFGQSVVCL